MNQIIKAIGIARLMRNRYKRKFRNPVVFVPGLYGSMGDDIIPGTGEWGFGIASSVYEPFIQELENMGYKLNESLFIAYYDWRKDCEYSMEKYLRPTIELAKKISGGRKVDIICHSMGGLVSRTYFQSKSYKYDVEKAIFIATPHTGAANTYSFWKEGKVLSKKDVESQLFTLIVEGYLWILTRLHNYSREIDAIHELIPGALDIMPNKDYGEYLYYFDEEKNIEFIPYEEMEYTNPFLDKLNSTKNLLETRRIDITLIVGKNISTNEKFQVKKSQSDFIEKIVVLHKSDEGDGTVILKSATAIEGDTYILHASHTEILKKAVFIIKDKLNIQQESLLKNNEIVDSKKREKYISILINCKGTVKIYQKTSKITKLLYDGIIKAENVFVEKYDHMLKWLIIYNVDEKEIIIDYEATEKDLMDIQVNSGLGKKIKFNEQNPTKGSKYRMRGS